jgi:hypothetical protein
VGCFRTTPPRLRSAAGHAGHRSAPWRAACSRAGVPPGGGDATGLEPRLSRVQNKQMRGYFLNFAHTFTPEHPGLGEQQVRALGGFDARGAWHRSGVRTQERDALARRWGAPGQAVAAQTSTCRKEERLARRPGLNLARRGERRTASWRANTENDDWRAPARDGKRGLDLGAGVRAVTACSSTSLHNTTTA